MSKRPRTDDTSERPCMIAVVIRTHLERLSPEIIQNILDHLPRKDILNLAQVCIELRDAAEHRLYTETSLPRVGKDSEIDSDGSEIWGLLRSLQNRPSLAHTVIRMCIVIIPQEIPDEVPTSSKGLTLIKPSVTRRIWTHLTNVRDFKLYMMHDRLFAAMPEGYEELMQHCLDNIIPRFNPFSTQILVPPIFQRLQTLTFHGDEFHWCLASSPYLEVLRLERVCRILPDSSPQQVGKALRALSISFGSQILRADSLLNDTFAPFVTHFTCLKTLDLTISDRAYDNPSPNKIASFEHPGSFEVLLQKLGALKNTLTCLTITMPEWDPESIEYLDHVSPAQCLPDFKVLKKLKVPSEFLFSLSDFEKYHQMISAREILPSSLVELEIGFPCKGMYQWLANSRKLSHMAPQLSQISLICSKYRGRDCEWFKSLLDHYPVSREKEGHNIHLSIIDEGCEEAWIE